MTKVWMPAVLHPDPLKPTVTVVLDPAFAAIRYATERYDVLAVVPASEPN
jgi:hypothetical protein